jgi:hypothetical protein
MKSYWEIEHIKFKKQKKLDIEGWFYNKMTVYDDYYYKIYNLFIKKQNNKCAICGKPQFKKRLSIDHNHKTDKIRGLLCNNCNILIGFAKDDIEILKEAINYLRKDKRRLY